MSNQPEQWKDDIIGRFWDNNDAFTAMAKQLNDLLPSVEMEETKYKHAKPSDNQPTKEELQKLIEQEKR